MTPSTVPVVLLGALVTTMWSFTTLRSPGAPSHIDPVISSECDLGSINPDSPDYYRIKLVPTRRYPGTHRAIGYGDVTFASSPFGVSISGTGTYVYDLKIRVERIREPKTGSFVVWLTTPDLKKVKRIGPLVAGEAHGRVDWNKFLVVVTLEEEDHADLESWSGPVILRGMSRSGMMHTMAGHGPFETEPCAQYGYQ